MKKQLEEKTFLSRSSRILHIIPAVETYQIKTKTSQSVGDKPRNLEEDRTVY